MDRENLNKFGKLPKEVFPKAIAGLKLKGLIDDKDGKLALARMETIGVSIERAVSLGNPHVAV